jgi:hypothetical protein
MWNLEHMKIKHFYSRINYKIFKKLLGATYFMQFLKGWPYEIFDITMSRQ